jgi:hypothetical protein
MFKVIVATVAVSLLQAGVIFGQGSPNKPDVEKQIVQNETAIMKGIVGNDPKAFHTYVLPDSYYVGADGIGKAADFDGMMKEMKEKCTFTKSDLGDSTFYWINDSTVVHIFKEMPRGTCEGRPLKDTWSSTVWTNKGGKWLAAFHHEAEAAEAAPPAKK